MRAPAAGPEGRRLGRGPARRSTAGPRRSAPRRSTGASPAPGRRRDSKPRPRGTAPSSRPRFPAASRAVRPPRSPGRTGRNRRRGDGRSETVWPAIARPAVSPIVLALSSCSTRRYSPRAGLKNSATSPAAKMSRSLVRSVESTRMPSPSSRPACGGQGDVRPDAQSGHHGVGGNRARWPSRPRVVTTTRPSVPSTPSTSSSARTSTPFCR